MSEQGIEGEQELFMWFTSIRERKRGGETESKLPDLWGATALARRFWVRRLTLQREYISTLRPWVLPLCVRCAIEGGYCRRIEIRDACGGWIC